MCILGVGKIIDSSMHRKSLVERFCLDNRNKKKLFIFVNLFACCNILFPCFRKLSFLPAGSLDREQTSSNIKYKITC